MCVVLPRISGAITDPLKRMSHLEPGHDVERLVLDFADVFWNVPPRHSERRFSTGKIANRFFIFLRAAQGSRNSPLSTAAIVSVALRCAQSLFFQQPSGTPPKAREALRLQTFVDHRKFALEKWPSWFSLWGALGFQLGFQKVARGSSVPWIAGVLKVAVLLLITSQRKLRERRWLKRRNGWNRSSALTLSPRRSCAQFWVSPTTLRPSFFQRGLSCHPRGQPYLFQQKRNPTFLRSARPGAASLGGFGHFGGAQALRLQLPMWSLGNQSFQPDIMSQSPGVPANVVASLSRRPEVQLRILHWPQTRRNTFCSQDKRVRCKSGIDLGVKLF